MQKMEKLRDMLCDELDRATEAAENGSISIDTIDKLTHSIKSIDTIIAMEESGYSRDDYGRVRAGNSYGNSYARKRDSMGRYTSARRSGGRYSRDDYSRDDAMMELRDQLEDMAMSAPDEHTKKMVHRWMEQLDK